MARGLANNPSLKAENVDTYKKMLAEVDGVLNSFVLLQDYDKSFYDGSRLLVPTASPPPLSHAPSPATSGPQTVPPSPVTPVRLVENDSYEVKWSLFGLSAPLAIDRQGTLYTMGTDNQGGSRIVAMSIKDGRRIGEYPLDRSGPGVGPEIAVSDDGWVYVVRQSESGKEATVDVMSGDGKTRAKRPIPTPVSWAVEPNGQLLLSTQTGLQLFDRDGSVVWRVDDSKFSGRLALGPDGEAYVLTNAALLKVDTAGSMLWAYADVPQGAIWPVRFTPDGDPMIALKDRANVVDGQTGKLKRSLTPGSKAFLNESVCDREGCYYQYDFVGAARLDWTKGVIWATVPEDRQYGGTKSFVEDAQGNVAFANNGGNVTAYNPEHKVLFRFVRNSKDFLYTTIYCAPDGTFVVSQTGMPLFAIGPITGH